MYKLHSIAWTFFLYHGVCLLPASIWGRQLWLSHIPRPTGRQWVVLLLASILSCLVALATYSFTGTMVVSRAHVMGALTERGYKAGALLPLAIYFVIVNSTLEELFWRGVILNELDYLDKRWRYAGTLLAAIAFAAWHYLVLRTLLEPGFAELAVVGVMLVGVFCSWIYRQTQSIVMAILWHGLVFDLSIIALFAGLAQRV